MTAAAFMVPKQDRLEAGFLPDDGDVVFVREPPRAFGARWIALSLIGIEKDKPRDRGDPFSANGRDPSHCHLHSGQGIARSRSQLLDDQV